LSNLPGAELFPITARVTADNHLELGGCDVVDLVASYGSPLYVYDEATIRAMCRSFRGAFGDVYPKVHVSYSSKAFANPALARILDSEGVGMDVVSGGELAVARAAGFPAAKLNFHGNNKSRADLAEAVDYGIGRITVDSFHELDLLDAVAADKGARQKILLRVSPSIDAHTHRLTTTGILDSKFGFSIETGAAEEAVKQATRRRGLELVGLHFHLGSPLFELEPYEEAIKYVMEFAARMRDRHGLKLDEFSPGGGFAAGYVADHLPPPIGDYARAIATALRAGCDANGFDEPTLIIEPGRAIVARAGVALYTVGAIKDIPNVRKYVSVDGGMGDNIRPAIYGSKYSAFCANRIGDAHDDPVTIAGWYCESGDILARDVPLPRVAAGDIVAMPASGAYQIPMSSNYNMARRPAIVMVSDGKASLMRRRETYDDLLATSRV
jgi:diaminopimelate decarboxylase